VSGAGSILVTGAAGFAGTHLLARLVREDTVVEGWHHPSGPPPAAAPRSNGPGDARATLRWRAVDLLDADVVGRAVADLNPARIYHLAGAADQGRSWQHSATALRVNAFGTHVLLTALARLGGLRRVLVTTSASVYAPSNTALTEESPIGPTSPYGVSKVGQELIARHAHATSPLAVIVCRPFNHIGPGQDPGFFAASFARQIAAIVRDGAPPVIRVGNLSARRDLTDVRDTVRGYEQLMDRGEPGAVYNVCRGETCEIREILDGLIAHSSLDVTVEVAPELLRPVDQPILLGSNARLCAATGWRPEIPLERTLRDLLDSWTGRQ
jgi:GDP-4-dehydro-6-deoxy-D-mannose reductase